MRWFWTVGWLVAAWVQPATDEAKKPEEERRRAEEEQQKAWTELRDKKLQAEFLKKAPWFTDYEKALAEAKKSGRLIFAYFTRSFAMCPYCLALERGTLSSDEFARFAEGYVLFCHITSRVKSDPFPNLLEEKGGEGWPFVAFLTPEGKVAAPHGATEERTVAAFEKTAKRAREYQELARRAASGDRAAEERLLELELEYRNLPAAEVLARLEKLGPVPEEKKNYLRKRWAEEEAAQVMRGLPASASPEELAAAGEKMEKIRKEGRVPRPASSVHDAFWLCILEHAFARRDSGLFETALGALRAKYKNEPDAAPFLAEQEARLGRLKEEEKSPSAPGEK